MRAPCRLMVDSRTFGNALDVRYTLVRHSRTSRRHTTAGTPFAAPPRRPYGCHDCAVSEGSPSGPQQKGGGRPPRSDDEIGRGVRRRGRGWRAIRPPVRQAQGCHDRPPRSAVGCRAQSDHGPTGRRFSAKHSQKSQRFPPFGSASQERREKSPAGIDRCSGSFAERTNRALASAMSLS